MNMNFLSPQHSAKEVADETMEALRKARERAAKDPAYGMKLLLSTGMYTKSGKIKKQFR